MRFEHFVNGINARAIAARNRVLVTTPQDVALEKDIVFKAHAEGVGSIRRVTRLMGEINAAPPSPTSPSRRPCGWRFGQRQRKSLRRLPAPFPVPQSGPGAWRFHRPPVGP
jgi:hypothetical protein